MKYQCRRIVCRRVALVTGLVRAQSGGDSASYAAPRRSMTGRAALLRARSSVTVLLMVKVCSEAAQAPRKLSGRRILLAQAFLRMADHAERRAGRIELCLMTTDAGFVSGKFRL